MIKTTDIDAHIHYRHTPEETAALTAAVIPMAEYIKAVAGASFYGRIKNILGGAYFRLGEASSMRAKLLQAAKRAKASLGDYFPAMRKEILINAQILEEATHDYWATLELARRQTVTTT
jgi:hypothetical protein